MFLQKWTGGLNGAVAGVLRKRPYIFRDMTFYREKKTMEEDEIRLCWEALLQYPFLTRVIKNINHAVRDNNKRKIDDVLMELYIFFVDLRRITTLGTLKKKLRHLLSSHKWQTTRYVWLKRRLKHPVDKKTGKPFCASTIKTYHSQMRGYKKSILRLNKEIAELVAELKQFADVKIAGDNVKLTLIHGGRYAARGYSLNTGALKRIY